MRLERRAPTHPDALALIDQVQQEYVLLYGTPDESPIVAEVFDPPGGAFFVGYLDERPVAMGGWRRRSDVDALGTDLTAEIKRMYVVESARGRGLARQVLAHLEQTAAAAGAEALVLETGIMQPEAMALYESSGYRPIDGFGHYRDSPLSRCYARRIAAGVTEGRLVWDAEAEHFDDEPDHGLGDPDTRAAWRALLLGILPEVPAALADLGCGTGTLSVLLAEAGYAVTGLDLSPAMVERARAKAAAADVALDLVVGDASRPDLPPAAFDVVLVRHVLWVMDDPATALRRWVELLRPGGILVLVEGSWHTGAGLTAAETEDLVRGLGRGAEVRAMPEPVFWGGETGDERYLVVSRVR